MLLTCCSREVQRARDRRRGGVDRISHLHLGDGAVFHLAQLRGIESRYGITIPAAAYYWRFLEFGTSKMRAKPFLRPTFDRLGQAALADVAFAGSKWIDKYLRSGGKI